jgi:2-dehydropantoate 2-reductase
MKINNVLIAGAGAVGLSVAETINKYDHNCVSILAKGERLERYRKSGLWVNDEKQDFRFSCGEKADLIIIATKYHQLNDVIEDIKPSLTKDTAIISLLNGISSEKIIAEKLGIKLPPLAMVLGTDALRDGEKTIYTQQVIIHFGDAEGKNGELEDRIAEFFTRSGVSFVLETNMRRKFWYKYMINVGINQTTAVLRLPYKALQFNGGKDAIMEAKLLMEKIMREVIAIANAEGVDLNESDIENVYPPLNKLNPNSSTSMCQDVIAGRKTEVELFSLTIMDLAKKHGISVPVNELLYLQIRTIEKRAGVDAPRMS